MDSIDRAIIDHLARDGRLSNIELADAVGLSPSPCLRRVRRLEATGVILGYHARLDPAAVGRSFEVHVDLELESPVREVVKRFEEAVVALEPVVELRRMFGAPDYLALVAVGDLVEYERFMTEELMALPGLARLQSRFAMKTLKSGVPS